MTESRRQHDWSQTSCILALTAEMNRNTKKKSTPFKPDDFNPMAKGNKGGDIEADITILRDLFVPQSKETQA